MASLYATLLADARFHELLLAFDADLADAARAGRCRHCDGALHSAKFKRKPRGRGCKLGPEHDQRFSFCCAVDGCRGRETPASLRFLEETPDAAIVLVGLERDVSAVLGSTRSTAKDRITVRAATEVVEMHEPPADALRRKKDSSMRVAINLVKDGSAQACISAGNTGALMAISRFVLKTLPGIDRPAIASQLPTRTGSTTALDLGANVKLDRVVLRPISRIEPGTETILIAPPGADHRSLRSLGGAGSSILGSGVATRMACASG